MKKKVLLPLIGLLVIVAAVALFFLLRPSGDNYLNAIPSDARMVCSIDVAGIVKKSGLGEKKLTDKLKQELGGMVSGDDIDNVVSYFEHPEKTGIDFRKRIYLFSTPDNSLCLLAKVGDKDKLSDFLTKMESEGGSTKPTTKNGLMWTKFFGEVPAAFNDDALLVMMPTDGFYNPNESITNFLGQGKKNSFFSTKKADRLNNAEGDITLFGSLASLPKNILGAYTQLLPKGVRQEEVDVTASLSALKGKLSFKTEISSDNEVLKALLEETNKNTHKIKGLYLKNSPREFVLWASAGFNGEWLLGQLKKEANLKQQLFLAERAIDIEKMIKSIDGDLMLTIPAIDSDAMFEVPYLLVGQTKNQDFLNDVDYWTTSMREYGLSMTSTGDNQYRLNADDMTFYWGTRPKELYFTSSPDLVKTALSGQGSDVLKALDDEIRDSRFFVYLNIQQMANSTNSYSSTGLTLSMLSQHFEGVSIRLTDAQNMELNILMKNKDENMLGALIGGLLDSLGALTRNFAR